MMRLCVQDLDEGAENNLKTSLVKRFQVINLQVGENAKEFVVT